MRSAVPSTASQSPCISSAIFPAFCFLIFPSLLLEERCVFLSPQKEKIGTLPSPSCWRGGVTTEVGEGHVYRVRVTGSRPLCSMVSSEQDKLLQSVSPHFCDKLSAQGLTPHCPPLSPSTTQQDGCHSSAASVSPIF